MDMELKIKVHSLNPGRLVDEKTLRAMLEAGYNLLVAAEAGTSSNKRAWFGDYGTQKSADIDARVKKIRLYLAGLKYICFSCSNTPDSIAAYNQKEKEKVEGGAGIDALDKRPTIVLNAGFHMERYSWGEKVCSILHEITHMTIGTSDEKYKGRDVYGAVECDTLAKESPEQAYRNADNWAYYLGSYWKNTINRGNDWKYMTPEEVAERGALV